jgi:hypothetical protein
MQPSTSKVTELFLFISLKHLLICSIFQSAAVLLMHRSCRLKDLEIASGVKKEFPKAKRTGIRKELGWKFIIDFFTSFQRIQDTHCS